MCSQKVAWLKVYGAQLPGKQPSEALEQVTFFNRLRSQYPDTYGAVAVHIRNEGRRTWNQAARDKAEGMTTGAADIMIPGAPSFACELKSKSKRAKLEPEQLVYLQAAHKLGAFVCIAYGCDAAWQAFEDWRSASVGT